MLDSPARRIVITTDPREVSSVPTFRFGDRVVLVDGRYGTVTATGIGLSIVALMDGELIGPVKDTDLSTAVDEDFERERRRDA